MKLTQLATLARELAMICFNGGGPSDEISNLAGEILKKLLDRATLIEADTVECK